MGTDADFAAAFAEGEDFAGVERTIGIEGIVDAAHEVEIGVGKKKGHEPGLFHADAVLAGERAADFHAVANDFGGSLHGALELTFVAGIVKNNGMKIAVAGVEDVANVEAVLRADFADATKRLRKLGAGNDSVENVVAGGEAAESAEGVFAAFPEEFALGVVAGEANFAGVMQIANFGDGDGLSCNGFREALDFEEKNGGAVAREAGVDEVLDDAERPAIEHFASGWSDGAGGDVNDGFGGVVHGIENGEKGFDGFGLAGEFDGDFGDERERAFGANEKAGQIVAWSVALRAANADDFSIGENELQGSDVIAGNAVSECVRTARVFGNVAADGAGFLAGRIGCEVEAMGLGGKGKIVIHNARLDDGALIFRVNREDAIHARESEHQTARAGKRASGEAGASAAADNGHVVFRGELDDLRNFLSGGGENNYFRAAFLDRAIVFVEKNLFRLKENGLRAEKLFEFAKKARVHMGRPAEAALAL